MIMYFFSSFQKTTQIYWKDSQTKLTNIQWSDKMVIVHCKSSCHWKAGKLRTLGLVLPHLLQVASFHLSLLISMLWCHIQSLDTFLLSDMFNRSLWDTSISPNFLSYMTSSPNNFLIFLGSITHYLFPERKWKFNAHIGRGIRKVPCNFHCVYHRVLRLEFLEVSTYTSISKRLSG
jgi:hypothetical protein